MVTTQTQSNPRRRWLIGAAVVVVIALIAGGIFFARNRNQANAPAEGDIVTVVRGDLAASATASGQVEAQRDARLTPRVSGTVAERYVNVGDTVAAGDPLLQLATADLERAVENAAQSLIIQESNLATLLAGASAADIAAAEAAVAAAQANLADLRDGPSPAELSAAEADLRAAEADVAAAAARLNDLTAAPGEDALRAAQIELNLAQTAATEAAQRHSTILVTEPDQFLSEDRLAELEESARAAAVQANARLAAAQEALDNLQNGSSGATAASQAAVNASAAQRDIVQAQLDLLLADPSASQIAAAQSSLARAEANLVALIDGPGNVQIAQANLAVTQARVALEQAQNNLARATLTAPFAGTITAVLVDEGEQTGGVAIQMIDSENLEIVLEVDEVDLADIDVGQTANVTLEAWPDDEFDAEVVSIAPSAMQTNSGLVTYEVFLGLGETERPILVGMTANADLVTSQQNDVLLLPNAAINIDRQEGTYRVNLIQRDSSGAITGFTETPITIGLRDGRNTQITSGVEAGDEVLIGDNLPVQQFGPPEDGEGGPPNGGPFG